MCLCVPTPAFDAIQIVMMMTFSSAWYLPYPRISLLKPSSCFIPCCCYFDHHWRFWEDNMQYDPLPPSANPFHDWLMLNCSVLWHVTLPPTVTPSSSFTIVHSSTLPTFPGFTCCFLTSDVTLLFSLCSSAGLLHLQTRLRPLPYTAAFLGLYIS